MIWIFIYSEVCICAFGDRVQDTHLRELTLSNLVCVPDKAMINVLPTPMHRGVALQSFIKSLFAGKQLTR